MNNLIPHFTVNLPTHNINETHLQGYVKTTLDDLIQTFGVPQEGFDKSTVEWSLQFEDGIVATIYDYKEDTTPKYLYDWHIGGHTSLAATRIGEILNCPIDILTK